MTVFRCKVGTSTLVNVHVSSKGLEICNLISPSLLKVTMEIDDITNISYQRATVEIASQKLQQSFLIECAAENEAVKLVLSIHLAKGYDPKPNSLHPSSPPKASAPSLPLFEDPAEAVQHWRVCIDAHREAMVTAHSKALLRFQEEALLRVRLAEAEKRWQTENRRWFKETTVCTEEVQRRFEVLQNSIRSLGNAAGGTRHETAAAVIAATKNQATKKASKPPKIEAEAREQQRADKTEATKKFAEEKAVEQEAATAAELKKKAGEEAEVLGGKRKADKASARRLAEEEAAKIVEQEDASPALVKKKAAEQEAQATEKNRNYDEAEAAFRTRIDSFNTTRAETLEIRGPEETGADMEGSAHPAPPCLLTPPPIGKGAPKVLSPVGNCIPTTLPPPRVPPSSISTSTEEDDVLDQKIRKLIEEGVWVAKRAPDGRNFYFKVSDKTKVWDLKKALKKEAGTVV